MSARLLVAAVAVLASLAGCIGTTPEQRERDALPPFPYDGDELHRPGQPCLLCHSEFALAGTVYERITDADGIGGVEVHIVDGMGRAIEATTNRVGTFIVRQGGGGRQGETSVSFEPVPPFTISMRGPAGEAQAMQSLVWREGSCAGCHTLDGPDEASAGRVFLTEGP